MTDEKEYCGEHLNCIYRLELLEKWREIMDKKINGIKTLLIANLTGIIMLLLSTIFWMLRA
jgi:hypothetical protein